MASIFEAGLYGIRDTKKWLLWIAIFSIGAIFLWKWKPVINPAALYCQNCGYGYEVRTDEFGNQYGDDLDSGCFLSRTDY